MSDKKYYWLKLKKDFFKRHDIQIIEAMPNGKDYILFYLKLLVESVDHEGNLRFNDTIPYDENMLSTITSTNIDVVRAAMKVFTGLKMIEVLEDHTIFMVEVENMLGSETYWAEQKRKKRSLDVPKALNVGQIPDNVQTISEMSNQEIEIDIEKDIDIDKELDKSKKESKHKYGEFNHVRLTETEYNKLLEEYGQDKISLFVKKVDEYCEQSGKTYKNYNLAIRNFIRNDKTKPVQQGKQSRFNGYQQREYDSSIEDKLLSKNDDVDTSEAMKFLNSRKGN